MTYIYIYFFFNLLRPVCISRLSASGCSQQQDLDVNRRFHGRGFRGRLNPSHTTIDLAFKSSRLSFRDISRGYSQEMLF